MFKDDQHMSVYNNRSQQILIDSFWLDVENKLDPKLQFNNSSLYDVSSP